MLYLFIHDFLITLVRNMPCAVGRIVEPTSLFFVVSKYKFVSFLETVRVLDASFIYLNPLIIVDVWLDGYQNYVIVINKPLLFFQSYMVTVFPTFVIPC